MLRQDLILLQTDGWVHKKIPIKSSLYNHPIIQFKLILPFPINPIPSRTKLIRTKHRSLSSRKLRKVDPYSMHLTQQK